MITNNTNITIYNKKMVGRNTMWLRTCIKGVNLFKVTKTSVGDKERTSADEITIRIPGNAFSQNKFFIDDIQFKSKSPQEIANYFTVQKGDLIVKDIIDDEIQNSGELLQNYDVMTVVSVTNNLSASPYSRHIKVICK